MSEPPPDPRPDDPSPTRMLPPDRSPEADRQRFPERTWPLTIVIAVALVAFTLGGLLGAALAGADEDRMPRGYRDGDQYGRQGWDGRGWDDRGWDDRGWDDRGWDDRGWDDRGSGPAPMPGPQPGPQPGRAPTG